MHAMALDFEQRFFDQMDRRFDGLDTAISQNTKLTIRIDERSKETAKRVKTLEDARKVRRGSGLVRYLSDKQLVFLFLVALILFLSIIAGLSGVKVPVFGL